MLRRVEVVDEEEELAVTSPAVEHLMEYHPNPPTAGHLIDDDTDADEQLTQTSGTGDDPVGDAFRTALASHSASEVDDEDDQEDEIVWNPKYVASTFVRIHAYTQRSSTESPSLPYLPLLNRSRFNQFILCSLFNRSNPFNLSNLFIQSSHLNPSPLRATHH